VDEHLGLRVEHRLVGERLVADLVERIGRVGDELAQEDLLVRVEGVDDEREKLVDLSLEGECLDSVGLCKTKSLACHTTFVLVWASFTFEARKAIVRL
jgi:homospermidine synthase